MRGPGLPPNVGQLLKTGIDALSLGDTDKAGQVARRLMAVAPRLADSHFLVGLTASALSDWGTARQAFKSTVGLNKNHAAGWANLARVFVMSGQYANAEVALEHALALAPDAPMVADVIGAVLSLLGHVPDALEWQRKAEAGSGAKGVFALSLARSLTFLGDTAGAREAAEAAIRRNRQSGQAWWILARLEHQKDGQLVARMRDAMTGAPEDEKTYFHYGLGKALEDLEEWDAAFKEYATGAALRRREVRYDEAAEEAIFQALEQSFTADWLERYSAQGAVSGKQPVFVIGQPRTGTTLVERIITAHSAVHSAGELQQFGMAMKRVTGLASPSPMNADIVKASTTEDPAAIGDMYLKTTRTLQGNGSLFVDKLPLNCLYAPLIHTSLKDAKLVHLVRGAADSCFASFKQLFADAYPHSYDLAEMARHHVRYRALMDLWRDRLGAAWYDVNYETLVADVEPEARRLMAHLELDWQDSVMDYHAQFGAVTTASASQVRQKAHTGSINRWQRFEKHLMPMLDVLEAAKLV